MGVCPFQGLVWNLSGGTSQRIGKYILYFNFSKLLLCIFENVLHMQTIVCLYKASDPLSCCLLAGIPFGLWFLLSSFSGQLNGFFAGLSSTFLWFHGTEPIFWGSGEREREQKKQHYPHSTPIPLFTQQRHLLCVSLPRRMRFLQGFQVLVLVT